MALTELTEVSKRMKALRKRLSVRDGRKWTQQQVSDAIDVAYRTFQSWENGEVETDAASYDKVALFYSTRLRETITRNWILFGQDEAPELPSIVNGAPSDALEEVREGIERLSAEVAELRKMLG